MRERQQAHQDTGEKRRDEHTIQGTHRIYFDIDDDYFNNNGKREWAMMDKCTFECSPLLLATNGNEWILLGKRIIFFFVNFLKRIAEERMNEKFFTVFILLPHWWTMSSNWWKIAACEDGWRIRNIKQQQQKREENICN